MHDTFKSNNKVKLVSSGQEYFSELLSLITNAENTIYIQTYILANDFTGKMILDSLIKAASRGVDVFIMIDGIASTHLPDSLISTLNQARIQFKYFEPIWKSKFFYFGRRMHQKVIVADAKLALVGGLNLADRYNDTKEQKAWLDFAVLVIGDVVAEIAYNCLQIWNEFAFVKKKEYNQTTIIDTISQEEQCLVRVRKNDWVWHQNEISTSYLEMFRTAKKQITILSSYFIPGKIIRRQLIQAVKRGVDIKIVITGESDVRISKWAERWLYDWLLRNNIEVYEYQKNILHAKMGISDEEWMTIGSYNINNISTYASIEVNVDIKNNRFIKEVIFKINNIIDNHCIKITRDIHLRNKNLFKQFGRWVSYQTIQFLFFMCTFYFKRKH